MSRSINARHVYSLAIVAMFTMSVAADAAPQRMRIPAGTFKLGASGARIPAQCLDFDRAIPAAMDAFTNVAGEAINVTRTQGGEHTSVPLEDAIAKGWIKISGDGSYTGLRVDVVRAQPDVQFEIASNGSVVGSVSGADTRAAVKALELRKDVLASAARLDVYDQQLSKLLGERNVVLEQFRKAKQELVWKYLQPDAPDLADATDAFLEGFRKLIQDENPAAALQKLTAMVGRKLSPEEIIASRQLFGTPVADTYEQAFVIEFSKWEGPHQRLLKSLSSDHPLLQQHHERLFSSTMADESIADAVAATNLSIVPEELATHPTGADVLGLLLGRTISAEQAGVLKEVSGRNLAAPTGTLDRHAIAVFDDEHSRLLIRSASDEQWVDLARVDANQLSARLAKHTLVVDELTPDHAKVLSDAGIPYVRKLDTLLSSSASTPKRTRVVLVGSKDPATSRRMFGDDHGDQVAALTATHADATGAQLVETKDELQQLLRNVREDERLVVVFNNDDGNIPLKDGIISIDDLPANVDVLTCNSFENDGLAFQTTDFIDVRSTLEALSRVRNKVAAGPISSDDFFEAWSKAYQDSMAERAASRRAAVTTAIGTTARGGTIIGAIIAASSPSTQPAKE